MRQSTQVSLSMLLAAQLPIYKLLTGNEFPLEREGLVGSGGGVGLVLQYPGHTDGNAEVEWDLGIYIKVSANAGSLGYMARITRDVGAGLGTIYDTFEGTSLEYNAHAVGIGGGVSFDSSTGSFEGIETRFGPGVGISQDITFTKSIFTARGIIYGGN